MWAFLGEIAKRVLGKTPWFFKVIQILGVVTTLITGLPEFLLDAGVQLPDAWTAVSSKVVSIAALVGTFVAQLAVTTEVKQEENIPD